MIRIIPARAGFTGAGQGRIYHGGDHPRSRGVYAARSAELRYWYGSSPLARGLHYPFTLAKREARIIPARAGFTLRTILDSGPYWDHPRSRGVYPNSLVGKRAAKGSSPLARGLPREVMGRPPINGIIPARAGFTHFPSPRPQPGRDHPRSRGVYRRCLFRGAYRARIIPARAGFTKWTQDLCNHFGGSSPLARGLLLLLAHIRVILGIIPARAGFTRKDSAGL